MHPLKNHFPVHALATLYKHRMTMHLFWGVISTSCSLAMTALHPIDEKQSAGGGFQDKSDTACTTLDTATSPMVSLPPAGFPCGYLACQARSTPATSTGSTAGATRVAHPPRTRSSAR